MSVPFNDPGNSFYATYAVAVGNFVMPDHFDVYEPDNSADFKCISVIVPSQAAGCPVWTSSGRWITIGIYRDEGRGSPYDEQYYVFRLLPSFKLVPYAMIQQIFSTTSPTLQTSQRSFYNVTTGMSVRAPHGKNSSLNWELPASPPVLLDLTTRFNQAYDEKGSALLQKYGPEGLPIPVNNVDSITKNNPTLFNSPIINELSPDGDDATADVVPDIYDFYGLQVNDPTRAPFHASDIVAADPTKAPPVNNLKRRNNGVADLFSGQLFDRYGNIVIGVQATNALTVRVPILPLQLDVFNRPVKTPVRKAVQ